jgi:hypothetical protein
MTLPATWTLFAARTDDPSSFSMNRLGECIYTLMVDNTGLDRFRLAPGQGAGP